MIVTTEEQLEQLVSEYMRYDEVVFDLETMYTPTAAEQEKFDDIHARPKRLWTPEEKAWEEVFRYKPTDAQVNETIWFGIATSGRSDAIATGHPKGALISPEHKAVTTPAEHYGEDDERAYTKGGKLSYRKIEVTIPAVFGPPPRQLDIDTACEILRPLFFDPDRRIINQNVKFDIKSLVRHFGDFIPGPYGELMIAQHIADENAFMSLDLEAQVKRLLAHEYDKLGSKGVQNFSFEKAARYAEQDARFVWFLWKRLKRILTREGLWDLFEFEMEVLNVLMRKEYSGAYVSSKLMSSTKVKYERRRTETERNLRSKLKLSPDFNLNSSQQKADLLYNQLKAPVLKKTDGGSPSTDADTLEMLVSEGGRAGEAAQMFLDYAEVNKVIGTYFVGMGAKLDHLGYIHPDFTQHVADTNRLSCREPNLHNIPRDSDMRDMFVAPRGKVVIGADYDQIELRGICAFSEDPGLQEVFLSGEDVHGMTAALVLGKDLADVTADERQNMGKMPNFLIGYGGSHYLLAAKTGISVEEAEAVFDAYFGRFKRIAPWKEELLDEALSKVVWRDGKMLVPPYVETMMGYRRRLPDLVLNPRRAGSREERSRLYKLRSRAERQAANALVQGSAAETLKIAMVDIRNHCEETGFPMRLALNIHDELVAYCDEKLAEEGREIVESLMTSVVNPFTGEPPLRGFVPLVASCYIADRWQKG